MLINKCSANYLEVKQIAFCVIRATIILRDCNDTQEHGGSCPSGTRCAVKRVWLSLWLWLTENRHTLLRLRPVRNISDVLDDE